MTIVLPQSETNSVVTELESRERWELQLAPNDVRNAEIFMRTSPAALVITEAVQPFLIVRVNRAWELLCGYEEEEVVGRSFRFLQGAETDQSLLDLLVQGIRRGENVSLVINNYHKSGEMFRNFLRVKPLFSSDGRITHYFGQLQDLDAAISQ